MAKHIWNCNIDREQSKTGCVVVNSKDGEYTVTVTANEKGVDCTVNSGDPTNDQMLEAIEFASVHGWI